MMPEALEFPTDLLARKFDLCMSTLIEARRLTDVRVYGPILSHLLGRAGELILEIDEILRGTGESAHPDAFAKASAFRRELGRLADVADRGRRAADVADRSRQNGRRP